MFFLTKMFKLRDKANPEEEKPFLDHLEDLRIMITRIAITLLISTLVCFIYKDELMKIIRHPVEQVWVERHEEKLPKDLKISLEEWENALRLSEVAPSLEQVDPALSKRWWDEVGDDRTRNLARAAVVFRAAGKLKAEQQKAFVESMSDDQKDVREITLKLLESGPTADLNEQGNLRLMSSLKPTETFMLTMKLAFFAGLIISFPLVLYFLLQFIIPGLKDSERRALWPSLAIGFGLFLGGVLFAYFYVLPNVLTFFYEWGRDMGISNDWRIGYYISFATTFVLIFGVAFELPVVVMALVKIGLLSHSMMKETRSYAILAIFVIAAVITPTPDMMTLSLLAVPMCILYEICIWLSYFHEKKVAKMEAAEEAERMERLLANPTPEPDPQPESKPENNDETPMDLTEEGEGEDISDDYMDDYMNYPGEHQSPEEDSTFDPLSPDDDIPDGEKDRE